jgi:hypothetical protein
MIRITLNSSCKVVSSRVNKKQFEKKASEILNSIVLPQIKVANNDKSTENFKNCNNHI